MNTVICARNVLMRLTFHRKEVTLSRRERMLSKDHRDAIEKLAKAQHWDQYGIDDLGVLLWGLFHYYVRRL